MNKLAYIYGRNYALLTLGIKTAGPTPAKPAMDAFGTAPAGFINSNTGTSRPFDGAQPGAPPQLVDVPRAAPATGPGPSPTSVSPAPTPPLGMTQAVGTTSLMDPLKSTTAEAGGTPQGMSTPTGGQPSMSSPSSGKGRK
jgi:hypothetical protein